MIHNARHALFSWVLLFYQKFLPGLLHISFYISVPVSAVIKFAKGCKYLPPTRQTIVTLHADPHDHHPRKIIFPFLILA